MAADECAGNYSSLKLLPIILVCILAFLLTGIIILCLVRKKKDPPAMQAAFKVDQIEESEQ